MTHIEQAIYDATDGGWKELRVPEDGLRIQKNGSNDQIYHYDWVWGCTATGLPRGIPLSNIFLDPHFWQALGKARGWRGSGRITAYQYDGVSQSPITVDMSELPLWRVEWHRFIDHLAEGKDAESFFVTLI